MIELLLAELKRLESTYQAGDAVHARLSEVTFVPVIGPFLTGKSTVMAEAVRLDHEFGRVRCFTTRPRRDGEPKDLYDFLPHTEATLRRILHEVEHKELVEFVIHPTTHYVYGSKVTAWHRPFMLLDTLPQAVEEMESIAFKALRPIALAVEPKEWTARLRGRNDSAPEQAKRIREGIANIEWCLTHDVAWLINSNRPPTETAKQLIAVAKGAANGESNGRSIAASLLTLLHATVKSL